MNKRVLCISSVFPTNKRASFGTFAYSLFKEIAFLGNKVDVISPISFSRRMIERIKYEKTWEIDMSLFLSVRRPNIYVVSTKFINNKYIHYYNFRALINAVSKESRKVDRPDLVLAYFFDSGCAAIESFENRIPVFVEIGESVFEYYFRFLPYEILLNYLNKFAGIIAVSKGNYDKILHYLKDSRKCILLENGVDTEKFHPIDKREARIKLGLPHEIFVVGFVGAFIERKGPIRLLNALNSIKNAYGLFIGRGDQVPKGDKVLFCGEIGNDNLNIYLSACDVFCLPSLNEGLSVAILEAAASGLPLIVSDRDFNRSFLNEENAIFIDPNSPGSIASGIKILMGNKELVYRMAKNNINLAEKHSLKMRVKKLFKFINNRLYDEH